VPGFDPSRIKGAAATQPLCLIEHTNHAPGCKRVTSTRVLTVTFPPLQQTGSRVSRNDAELDYTGGEQASTGLLAGG